MSLESIANNALGKLGGAGDQVTGKAFITAALLTANTDRVSIWVNTKYPTIRQKVIADFAGEKCPFRETLKFADLGPELKRYDIAISSIVSALTVVTITTAEAHGRAEGDTVYLAEIEQDSDEDIDDIEQALITSLNGTTVTIDSVPSTTTFTIDTAGVDLTWSHEADTGIVSYVPEMGAWEYAFNLPSDYHAMVRHCDESYTVKNGVRKEYQYQTILNRDGDGLILLTNDFSNLGANSAYIEYVIDQTDFDLFSPALEEAIATLMAAELSPILGRNLKVRQEFLLEYKQLTVPDAKRYNQSQFNNSAKVVRDYSGGRSGRGGGVNTGLGTYLGVDGLRHEI